MNENSTVKYEICADNGVENEKYQYTVVKKIKKGVEM